jgi:DegV family protein with EDD domain
MSAIAIITDTDSSLPSDLAARCGIRQVPINIHFGQETFRSGIDLDDASMFARIDREGVMPTPSAPSPGQFVEAYQDAFDAGADELVCICVSGAASATYAAALQAREFFPGRPITVVDSQSATMGEGFMVLAAAEAVQAGASANEALARALEIRERTHLYAALSTLKYLALSGRVAALTAGVANLLNVKPIITLRDGTLDLLERVRTQRKAWRRVIELAVAAAGERPLERLAVLHVAAPDAAHEFQALLAAQLSLPESTLVAELTPGLSIYGGAGLVGVALVTTL